MRTKYDKVLGSLYGMATGDALGVPSSFLTPEHIKRVWGWINTFYPPEKGHIFHDGLNAGEYTDDTEQALALIKSFKSTHKVNPYEVVNEILKWAKRVENKYKSPLGPSTEKALKAIQNGAPIEESGIYGNTNGSAMRISPIGIIHGLIGNSSMEECVKDVYQTCIPTHNTTVCVACASAIAWAVALSIRGEEDIETIIKESAKAADEGSQYGHEIASPKVSKKILWAYEIIKPYFDNPREGLSELYDYFGGGDLAADSIPIALALFALGKGNVKEVNELCVNLGGDCDTNAAMAGAIAGAYSSIETVPKEWIETIESVNKVNMPQYAEDCIEIAKTWEIAE